MAIKVTYEQKNPDKLLSTEYYDTYEKAHYWADKWLEKQRDSYNPRTGIHDGPDFVYTIWL